ncbi:hypothetical protein HF086_010859 [Spodoptera exigua]|uniref:Uncharacterized protein n=1 Tax=Spodoptera exigua TaxID=7107 RepID=A0A922MCX4_SPOEX|nr:hypothetical protein HF086_010859 [Spodoptera exigua]
MSTSNRTENRQKVCGAYPGMELRRVAGTFWLRLAEDRVLWRLKRSMTRPKELQDEDDRLDRKSSRGMLYENEELRLRTININAEVERGQSDIKKLKRENEQLKREISALRYEYDRLDSMLRDRRSSPEHSDIEGKHT